MSRRKVDARLLDTSEWPTECITAEDPGGDTIVHRRKAALEQYCSWRPVGEITAATKIRRDELVRLFNRATKRAPDGALWGFRVCAPYIRVEAYQRTRKSKRPKSLHGHAGELSRFLNDNPGLEADLRKYFLNYLKRNRAVPSHRLFRNEFFRLRSYHTCLGEGSWITISEMSAATSLARLRNFWRSEYSVKATSATYGAEPAKKLGSGEGRRPELNGIYQSVQFDAHCIDALFGIEIINQKGLLELLLLDRIWILAIREVATGPILGYHISFASNYTEDDVLMCVENAIVPWKPKELTIDALKYADGAGFPSGSIPELEYALFRSFAADNFTSNVSKRVFKQLKKWGIHQELSQSATPQSNDVIEGLFSMFARYLRELPNTTGSGPDDIKRRNPEKAVQRYHMSVDQLYELVDVLLANMNVGAEGGGGRNALGQLRTNVKSGRFFIEQVPSEERESFCLTSVIKTVKVVGNPAKGEALHINYENVEYSSVGLRLCTSFLGKKFKIKVNLRDLRKCILYLPDGTEYGVLEASFGWNITAHDLPTRKAIFRHLRLGKFKPTEDNIAAFRNWVASTANKRKRDRNTLAHIQQVSGSKAIPDARRQKREKKKITFKRVITTRFQLPDDSINL